MAEGIKTRLSIGRYTKSRMDSNIGNHASQTRYLCSTFLVLEKFLKRIKASSVRYMI